MQVQIYCLPISATLWFYPSNNTVLPHTIWCHYKCISEFLQTCLVTITAAVVQHGEVPNTDGNISKMSNREKLETRIGTQRMIARKVLTPFTIPLPRTHALNSAMLQGSFSSSLENHEDTSCGLPPTRFACLMQHAILWNSSVASVSDTLLSDWSNSTLPPASRLVTHTRFSVSCTQKFKFLLCRKLQEHCTVPHSVKLTHKQQVFSAYN